MGCIGYCSFGIYFGGVFNMLVLVSVNLLVGNLVDVVGFEIIMGVVELCFICDICIVFGGDDIGVIFDGKFVVVCWSILVCVGSVFKLSLVVVDLFE